MSDERSMQGMRLAAGLFVFAMAMANGAAWAQPNADAGSANATTDEDEATQPLPEADRPRLHVELKPRDRVSVGEIVTLTIRAEAPMGNDVAVPKQSFAPFELDGRHSHLEPAGAGKQAFVFELELLALSPGDHAIGPVQLRVVTKNGALGEVETEPVVVSVASLIANEPNAQLKPPSKPVRVMQDDYTLLWVLGAIVAMALTALATLWIARWWRKRKKALTPPPPPRPPWEVAIERLELLRREKDAALANGELESWVDRVSDTAREYLGARYGFDGLETTTDEMIAHLRSASSPGIPLVEIVAFLGDCDLVKFARALPDEEQSNAILGGALHIVRTTTPESAVFMQAAPTEMHANAP